MQAEEIFCDAVGLRVFGGDYLLAFAYLLSPGNTGKRLPGYPNLGARVEHMRAACQVFAVPDPGIDKAVFDERPDWELPSDRLLMKLADESVKGVVSQLLHDVDETAKKAKILGPDEKAIDDILVKFRWGVPAAQCRCLRTF